ncbi:helix-turn-helix domain-containing protein [Membranicola marinus]|uniref:Helix-turn-helix domain-containing protein n=1 Tax=Membranihabitans marinus TaxID=1227546 RepID=A0A953HKN2_9BACT|nr:helix-turn-helix domain-containing protein [Membranihabitans marinus]MBY5956809.1 helix-turn-helix domain-containing protein [Membranihabitans marinus]
MNILQILVAVDILVVLMVLAFHLKKPHQYQRSFYQVLTSFLVFLLFHFVYVFVSKIWFPEGGWVENSAPFGLMYGPFLYVLLKTRLTDRIVPRQVVMHALPYLVFLVLQLTFLIIQLEYRTPIARIYMKILYSLIPVSFIGYGLISSRIIHKSQYRINPRFYIVLICNILMLFILSLFFINIILKDSIFLQKPGVDVGGLMIYTFFLLSLLSIFLFICNRKPIIIGNSVVEGQKIDVTPSNPSQEYLESDSQYKKSGLTESDLMTYEKDLDKLMENEKLWLDPDLNLDFLADCLKVPSHHLTQVLSVRKNKNFNEYINTMRVEHACHLIHHKGDEISLTEVAYQSGFNSRSTFYRWFKKLLKKTPANYQAEQR